MVELPDPEDLETARQREVRRRWLYRLGLVVLGAAFYVNLMLGLFGTAMAYVSQQIWWGWAVLGSVVLVGLPVVAFLFLQSWRERHSRDAHLALLERLEIDPPSRWLRLAGVLAFAGVLGGISGWFTSYDMQLAWSLIVSLQLVSIPFRFYRLGVSWGWAAHLVLWVLGSIALIQVTYPWVGEDGVMWVGIATLLLSPTMVVNLSLSKQVIRASVETPGQGLGRLEPLLAFHHLAEVYLQRGQGEVLEPWMRRIVSLRPRHEGTFVLLGRVLTAREDPAQRDYWALGAKLLPMSAEVFAQLSSCVEDAALALAYAEFAEANALRRPAGLDTQRYTDLVRSAKNQD